MADSQSTSGLDLHVVLAGRERRASLERQLRDAVRDGRLAAGTRLPASRTLAADLGVARQTVAGAYDQLVAEGWLLARQGSGTRVADRGTPPVARGGGIVPVQQPPRFSLVPGAPDLSAFPRADWSRAAQQALSDAPAAALGYGDPRGLTQLRDALAGYLGRVRGVVASPDRIVVCAGFTQGLGLLCRVLAARGATTIGFERFSIADHRAVASANALTPVVIPMDGQGADLTEAAEHGGVVLTPAHQFPTGAVLSPSRRRLALAWSERTGGLVVEDDYDGEFRYDRQPVGAVQGLAPERVVYCGTASKTLAPGIRLGWLVLPRDLVDDTVEAKRLADAQSHALDQLTLARLIESGGYDRHVRKARLAYRRRRNLLVQTLREAPGRDGRVLGVSGIAAGLHLVAALPPGRTERGVVAAGARHGVGLQGLAEYAADGAAVRPSLVIGYGTPASHAFSGAVARLMATLRDSKTA